MSFYSTLCGFIAVIVITRSWFLAILASTVIFNVAGGWKYTKTLVRDIKGVGNVINIKRLLARYEKSNATVITCFEATVKKYPTRIMFKFEGTRSTFSETNKRAEKIASFFQARGVNKGDCVALLLENTPDLVVYWLGLAKIGAISSLINFNLKQKPLSHSLNTCSPKFVICAENLLSNLKGVISDLKLTTSDNFISSILIHVENFGHTERSLENFENVSKKLDEQLVDYKRPELTLHDTLLYIYTSGTTGFPKAAKITNFRFMNMAVSVGYLNKITAEDVIWTPLPLYHSNAGILAAGQAVYNGACIAFRRKFSASRFWQDIVDTEATAFNYLGEICRYIYNQPECAEERTHKIRTIFGNGLKKNLWIDMKKRYSIEHICEIYGSTEGNCNLVNADETPGACGFLSIIFPNDLIKIYLVKCDDEGNLIRDKNGLCVTTKPGEQGLILGKIEDRDPTKQFDGYVGESETKKKVAKNIKKHGDEAFVSGDILYMDELGYLYFKDRTGDTFRWKGENVSTCEVETSLLNSIDNKDIIVYGVEVPGADGKAGMAAISNEDDSVDMTRVSEAALSLPSYARPLFIRLLRASVEQHLTGTFKLRKVDLQKEGFNVEVIKDPIWFWVAKLSKYELMSHDTYTNIVQGKLML